MPNTAAIGTAQDKTLMLDNPVVATSASAAAAAAARRRGRQRRRPASSRTLRKLSLAQLPGDERRCVFDETAGSEVATGTTRNRVATCNKAFHGRTR